MAGAIRESKWILRCAQNDKPILMTTHKVGIIMNGVTGRMGTNQHLLRSIKAIIEQGGIKLGDTEVIMPDPILVGRSESKLAALAARANVQRYTKHPVAELHAPANQLYL